MGDRMFSLLSVLQDVLLGDDHDEGDERTYQPSRGMAEADTGANPQQAILQQLLLVSQSQALCCMEPASKPTQPTV